jgi:uncharacterized protein with NRDE domain
MEKKDLREMLQSGRIIELRDGDIGIIIQTHLGLLVQFNASWNNFDNYNSDLTHMWLPEHDIVKIREIRDEYQILRVGFLDARTIWERKEVKEYNLDEVLEMAGLDKAEVKIVG